MCRSQDPPDIAAKCLRMIQDEELRTRTTENGSLLVADHFSWDRIGELLEEILLDCVGETRESDSRGAGGARPV